MTSTATLPTTRAAVGAATPTVIALTLPGFSSIQSSILIPAAVTEAMTGSSFAPILACMSDSDAVRIFDGWPARLRSSRSPQRRPGAVLLDDREGSGRLLLRREILGRLLARHRQRHRLDPRGVDVGMTRCSESYSPRRDAEIMSRTSPVCRLLKLPRSAAGATTFVDALAASWV